MFFKFDRRVRLLNVDDSFAQLNNITDNEDLEFTFFYSINQLAAIKQKSLTVSVSILSSVIKPRPLLESSYSGMLDTTQLVKNIQKQMQNAKMSIKERDGYVISSKMSDITSKINNEIVPQLRAGVSKDNIRQLKKTKLITKPVVELNQDNQVKPLLQIIAHPTIDTTVENTASSSINIDSRVNMIDMIVRQGIDPSVMTDMTHRSISSRNSLGGMLRKSKVPERSYEPKTQLLNYHLFLDNNNPFKNISSQVDGTTIINVDSVVTTEDVEVPVNIVLAKNKRFQKGEEQSKFLVKFELIDSVTGGVIDQVIKTLDVSRHLQLYYTPKKPPIVQTSHSDIKSKLNLEIKQVDLGANAVQVFKKVIYRSSNEIDDYTLVGVYPLLSNQQSLLVQVEKPMYSTILYRVIPVGTKGSQGFDYTNIVINPSHPRKINSVSITTELTQLGIDIQVRSIPTSVVAIEIKRKNLTIHEKSYTNVSNIKLIDSETRVSDQFLITDTSPLDGRVYEYVANLIHKDGTSEIAGSAIVEYIPAKPGKIDIKISDVEVSHDSSEPNVTFIVRSNVIDSDIDVVRSLLTKQGISEYFGDDLQREREFLKGLIAHNIQRVNLTSGQREDFGVVTNEYFDDKEFRVNSSVKPLEYGNKYRYEVSTLIRQPETLFDLLKKTKVDQVTKKPYNFSPSKFLHPITLKRGTIVTPSGVKTKFSKDAMSHGATGAMKTLDVSFDNQPAKILNPTAARFNKKLNVITWKLVGSIDQVDHFLIMKDVHGVRTVIGKAHSEFEFGNCQYIHVTSEQDMGELKYLIKPIYNDYSIGLAAVTNSVIT